MDLWIEAFARTIKQLNLTFKDSQVSLKDIDDHTKSFMDLWLSKVSLSRPFKGPYQGGSRKAMIISYISMPEL